MICLLIILTIWIVVLLVVWIRNLHDLCILRDDYNRELETLIDLKRENTRLRSTVNTLNEKVGRWAHAPSRGANGKFTKGKPVPHLAPE